MNRLKLDAKNLLNRKTLDESGIKSLLDKAAKACHFASYTNSEFIYNNVFSRDNENGMASLFDKATHLTTEYSKIQTENYNINFIFKDYRDNDVYEIVYPKMSLLLLFLNVMQIELYSRMKSTNKKYKNWMLFTSIGAYEALFIKGKSKYLKFINSDFIDFLNCLQCSSQIRVKKRDMARLLIGEKLDCPNCYTGHHFPFGWLLSKVDIDLSDL
ncbi:MAG: hypothetical protein ACTHND_10990 [Asticcacaulis sp.]